jgi:hypothetical protein
VPNTVVSVQGLRDVEKKLLKRSQGDKKEKRTGYWREVYNELPNCYFS